MTFPAYHPPPNPTTKASSFENQMANGLLLCYPIADLRFASEKEGGGARG